MGLAPLVELHHVVQGATELPHSSAQRASKTTSPRWMRLILVALAKVLEVPIAWHQQTCPLASSECLQCDRQVRYIREEPLVL